MFKLSSEMLYGWTYGCIEDLEDRDGECEACATKIRYVFHVTHPDYAPMAVGCCCAEKMTRSKLKAIEAQFKSDRKRYPLWARYTWTPLFGQEGACCQVEGVWIKVKKLRRKWVAEFTGYEFFYFEACRLPQAIQKAVGQLKNVKQRTDWVMIGATPCHFKHAK
jgi:hypothetical protein